MKLIDVPPDTLTLRDRFALAALPTVMAQADLSIFHDEPREEVLHASLDVMASYAYEVAEAMIRVRELYIPQGDKEA